MVAKRITLPLLSYELLLLFCSIFIVRATAVLYAMQFASKSNAKFTIYTDSMSCFQIVKSYNHSNHIIEFVRNILISQPYQIRIMWVPGHLYTKGNTIVDNTAKDMNSTPTISNFICKFYCYLSFIYLFK